MYRHLLLWLALKVHHVVVQISQRSKATLAALTEKGFVFRVLALVGNQLAWAAEVLIATRLVALVGLVGGVGNLLVQI